MLESSTESLGAPSLSSAVFVEGLLLWSTECLFSLHSPVWLNTLGGCEHLSIPAKDCCDTVLLAQPTFESVQHLVMSFSG